MSCEHCGATFIPGHPTRRFCSDSCRGKAYHGRTRTPVKPRPCLACGETFTPKRHHGRYCSDRCMYRANQREKRGIPVGPEERRCWWCDGPFTAVRWTHQRCCSDGCRRMLAGLSAHRVKYGITPDEYRALWRKQGGLCAVCGNAERGQRIRLLCVDHDHDDGRVRGLLCDGCNRGIGLLGDSAEVLERAAAYLWAAHGVTLGS